MNPTPPNNLPKVENLPKKVAVATVLVLVGHGLVLWGLSKVKTVEIKPIQTPPIQVKFVKIAEPPVEEKPPVAPPPPPKPKPIEKKPEPTPPKPKPPVEKPKPPVEKPKPPVEKPKLVNPPPQILNTQNANHKRLETERLERERQERLQREQAELDRKRREQDELDRKRREQDELDRKRREQEELDRKRSEDEINNTPKQISEGQLAWKRGKPSISSRIIEINLDKGESVKIVVGFSAQANGTITNAWIEQSSGKKSLDDAAVRSVKSAALKPYPHPVKAKVSFGLTLK